MWPLIIAGALLYLIFRGQGIGLGHGHVTMPQFPGSAGIVQTLALMVGMTNQAIDHPLIRQHAVRATEHVNRGDGKRAAIAIGEYVRGRMRYVPDPLHKENLTNPATIITAIHEGKKVFGDCDDMAMLVAALGKSIGIQPYFHAVARQDRFHHVYTELAGLPIDPTVGIGIKPFNAQRRITAKV